MDKEKIELIRRLENEYNSLLQDLEVEKERHHALEQQLHADYINHRHYMGNWWLQPLDGMSVIELKQHAERLETFYGLIIDRIRYLQYPSLEMPLMPYQMMFHEQQPPHALIPPVMEQRLSPDPQIQNFKMISSVSIKDSSVSCLF